MGYTENISSILKWGNSFQRQFDFPLDRSSLHSSYEDAVAYAKGDDSDERALGGKAYIGQIITVWGLNEKGKEGVWVYSLVPSSTEGHLADLKPVGAGSATETATNYSAAKVLSNDLVVGQLIKVENEETITTGEGESAVSIIYQAGFYIVETPGTISALDTSTGASNEVSALRNKITLLEGQILELRSIIENIEKTIITTNNIGDHAVTSIKSSSSDLTFNDNDWDNTTEYKGDVTITLSNISNISFGDSDEIHEIE